MLALVALAYGLLCVRLRVCVQASWASAEGSAALSIGACGITLRYDARLVFGERGRLIRTLPRYGRQKPDGEESPLRKRLRSRMGPYLRSALLGRRFERIEASVRLGLDDAAQTAIVCGAVHALLCALLSPVNKEQGSRLDVQPVFSGTCLCACLRGIFSFQLGDIMLAALKSALRKTGKEGFRWKNIPLRA